MKLIFIGPQASGKGTQGKIIASKLGLCHISAGDLLRNSKGKLKEKIDYYLTKGKLVPPIIIFNMIKEKIESSECKNGFILDGFPRSMDQVEMLEKVVKIDKVIEIYIPDNIAIKRLVSRLNCEKCNAVFNTITNPPKKQEICDICGGKLYRRKDDTELAIKERLKIYHRETEDILHKFDSIRINGQQKIEKVTEDILKELKE